MAVFGLKACFVLPVDEQAFGTCRQKETSEKALMRS